MHCVLVFVIRLQGTHVFLQCIKDKVSAPVVFQVLKQEQEEYMREGIEWQHVDYFNNKVICDLVEQPHKGVLAILDEACLSVGKVTDEV